MEEIPVANSGIEVAVANKTNPTNVCPRPVLTAIVSVEEARNFPENKIITEVDAKIIHRATILEGMKVSI